MSLKVLGGLYKGLTLHIDKAFVDRPTSVILRRKIFDANQNMAQIIFVDLCAGTGMMGLEALSRGAQEVWFIEQNRKYLNTLKKNIQDKKIGQNCHFICQDSLQFLKSLSLKEQTFHNWIFFLDPPYHKKKLYIESFKLIRSLPGRIEIWIEASKQKNFSIDEFQKEFGFYDNVYNHGSNYLAVYKPEG